MKPTCASTSDAFQDDFVLKMLDYSDKGYFIDVGSGMPVKGSNSYRLEQAGWDGICIDGQAYPGYEHRNCKFFVGNALSVDYKVLFQNHKVPKVVDYLSLDIDEYTTDLLKLIPFDDYTYKIIIIEHDAYLRDPYFRIQQREIISNAGYHLLCSDVWPDSLKRHNIPDGPFEDWWVNKEFFSESLLNKMQCDNLYGSQVVQKFGLSSIDFVI
jgi:hypothetical protein